MPISQKLLQSVTTGTPQQAWQAVADHLWTEFSQAIPAAVADAEIVKRERDLTELENVVSGSAWEMWEEFESSVPKASQAIVDFWHNTSGGKAVLILDGLSLREVPFLQEEATKRGYKIHQAASCGSELPCETTPFARALGFNQRSSLGGDKAGKAHRLDGAVTESAELPWQDCTALVGNHVSVIFWHHWPDNRIDGDLCKPGAGLHKLAREIHTAMTSDVFWKFIERLADGRRLVITSDHGYAACGHFPDLVDKDQVAYMKKLFKNGRTAASATEDGSWVPPIDLRLTTTHGTFQYVLGRRKWKSPSGYPTLQHGGLSLLEVFVPFFEIS